MKETDVAWAAGLFEGEGCFSRIRNSPQLTLSSTDEDVIQKFYDIVGVGCVYGPLATYKNHHKPQYRWQSQSRKDCKLVIELLLPYLCSRRQEKAQEILLFINEYMHKEKMHIGGTCKNGHALIESNVWICNDNRRKSTYLKCRICSKERKRNEKLQTMRLS